MPSYKTHLAGGLATYVILYSIHQLIAPLTKFSAFDHIVLASITLVGSLFPDIDTRSKIQKVFFLCSVGVIPIAILFKQYFFAILGCFCFFILIIPHRGITHKLWFIIGFPIMLSCFIIGRNPQLSTTIVTGCTYFVFGALSHRLLDMGVAKFFSGR